MNWYLVKLVFQVCLAGNNCSTQFEEKLKLLYATDRQAALHKASTNGEQEETAFVNAKGEAVKWTFIAVSELRLFPDLTDGMELDSHLEEMPAAEAYIALQREKHKQLFLETH